MSFKPLICEHYMNQLIMKLIHMVNQLKTFCRALLEHAISEVSRSISFGLTKC